MAIPSVTLLAAACTVTVRAFFHRRAGSGDAELNSAVESARGDGRSAGVKVDEPGQLQAHVKR
jgi:hypothetical protein